MFVQSQNLKESNQLKLNAEVLVFIRGFYYTFHTKKLNVEFQSVQLMKHEAT